VSSQFLIFKVINFILHYRRNAVLSALLQYLSSKPNFKVFKRHRVRQNFKHERYSASSDVTDSVQSIDDQFVDSDNIHEKFQYSATDIKIQIWVRGVSKFRLARLASTLLDRMLSALNEFVLECFILPMPACQFLQKSCDSVTPIHSTFEVMRRHQSEFVSCFQLIDRIDAVEVILINFQILIKK
jgi:hypothetical protein